MRIKTIEQIIALANEKKSVDINCMTRRQILPAAVVQNWQAKYLHNILKRCDVQIYDKGVK